MSTVKVAITLDRKLLDELDRLVKRRLYPNRSQAIRAAVSEKLGSIEGNRLAVECAKLDPAYEQALADEGFSNGDEPWPDY